ncbi:beta strand repeat-containing protein, partial [Pseudomonas sp. 22526]|uniref:beta strand repeat-containing protein n=1 Tax=Pseudomonas sp. 22526 TaxID=3453937 RepID=UPI003F8381BC
TNTAAVAVKYDDAATKDQVTFNPAGTSVRLTNVAGGTLNATSTDAVNGSQLFATSQNTAAALGGGAAVNATTGAWTAPSYSTNSISANGSNIGPLVSGDVGTALTNLNTSVTNTAAVAVKYDDASTKTQVTFNPAGTAVKLTNVAAGTLNASSTDAVNGSQLFATNQTVDNIVNNGAGIKYFHSNSTLADSSATGQDSVAIGPLASATVANGVALGSNSSATGTTLANAAYGVGGAATAGGEVNIANGADGRRITGLAAGSSATDAVNVSQLNKAGQDTATALGGGAALDTTTGIWTAPSYSTNSISTTGANTGPLVSSNVGAALSDLNTSLTNTAAVAVKYDDAATKDQVTFNPAGTAVKLTNIAVGALNATSTDAVNGSQLFATNQTVDNLVNNGAGIKYFHSNSTLADSNATGQDSVAIGPLASATIANGVALGSNSSATGMTLANAAYGVGGAATGGEVNIANGADGRRITGLAAGSSATDAVNVSQLNKAGQDTATALGGGAALDTTTGVWTAPSYSTNSISVTGANTGPLVSNDVGAALSNLNTSVTNTAAVAVKYDDAATKDQVTFNPAGTSVRLTNVAGGTLNATSTDAVNGSQLFATSQNTAAALGGGAAVNATTGAWTAPSYSTNSISANGSNIGPLVSGDVGTALTNLN